ncbi:MAG: CDP-diacylglycerol--serine O-phosphatidyltransferase [Candidatus Paceibacteria bacterium]|jgi:CDP-diacylglycerol--serine O-phosphatidyltransferase
MKPVQMLPNLLTLANCGCGLLAISKGIDALAYVGENERLFFLKMEAACWLIFLGMVFDSLDGKVARLTKSFSDFGAQLDSFADAITFCVAPALLAKILIEHESEFLGYDGTPRLHFAAAAAFTLMGILRLARFNLETEHEPEAHEGFSGLPSPGAAGAVAATLMVYLILRLPSLESAHGSVTPVGKMFGFLGEMDWKPVLSWMPHYLAVALPAIGLLMVSRVPYLHVASMLTRDKSPFLALVAVVFVSFGLYLAPVPFLFIAFNGFLLFGVLNWAMASMRARKVVGQDQQT